MKIEVVKRYGEKEMRAEEQRLAAKHEDPAKAKRELLTQKCRNFDLVDDLMVLSALRHPDTEMTERVIFQSYQFYHEITPRRMELLEYISTRPVTSIKDLAIKLKRDYKNVYDDVKGLNQIGLVEYAKEGKNRRPYTLVDRIMITIGGK